MIESRYLYCSFCSLSDKCTFGIPPKSNTRATENMDAYRYICQFLSNLALTAQRKGIESNSLMSEFETCHLMTVKFVYIW